MERGLWGEVRAPGAADPFPRTCLLGAQERWAVSKARQSSVGRIGAKKDLLPRWGVPGRVGPDSLLASV